LAICGAKLNESLLLIRVLNVVFFFSSFQKPLGPY
jgi:hypothetical protein